MKKGIIISLVIGLLLLTIISAWSSITLGNGLSTENLTFTGNQNITRNISIPYNTAFLTSAFLNLTGFKVTNTTDKENSYSCSGSFSQGACSFGVDEMHYSDNAVEAGGFNGSVMIENVSFPNTFTNVNWTTEGTYAYDTSCTPTTGFSYQEIYYWRWSDSTWQFLMYNNGQQTLTTKAFENTPSCPTIGLSNRIISSRQVPEVGLNRTTNEVRIKTVFIGNFSGGTSSRSFYQEGQTDSFSYPSNLTVSVGTNVSYTYSDVFNQTNIRTSNLSTVINSYMNSTYLNSTSYNIPLVFHSDSAGILQYSDLNFTGKSYAVVSLTTPINNTVASNNYTLNASFTSEVSMTNATLYVWNSTSLYNKTLTTVTGLTNSSSVFMNFSKSDTYQWNYYVCNNYPLCAFTSPNYTIIIDNANPVINQIFPANNQYLSYKNNVNFNCSATSANLDAILLYGNFSGTYKLNQSISGITSGATNSFKLNLTDGYYSWSCSVNKTLGSTIYAGQQGNYTVAIVSTPPQISISSLTTTTGFQTITFQSLTSSISPLSCKYSIFNSSGGIDGLNNNVSYSCDTLGSATVSDFSTYNLTIYALDLAGTESSATLSFTTSATSGSTTSSGGGGSGGKPKSRVVALVKPTQDLGTYASITRAIIFSRIRNFTEGLQTTDLTSAQLLQLSGILAKNQIALTTENLKNWVTNYANKQYDVVEVEEDEVAQYDLVKAEVIFGSAFSVNPAFINSYTFISLCSGDAPKTWMTKVSATKLFDSCQATEGLFNCTVESQSVARLTYVFRDSNITLSNVEGAIEYVSTDKELARTKIQYLSVVNICGKVSVGGFKINIVLFYSGIVIIGGLTLFYLSKMIRGKKK